MKILVILTGGTIGSSISDGRIDVRSDGNCPVVEEYAKANYDVQFDLMNPINILSERLSANDLSALAKAILMADYADYDGVIVTSGSDNLAYIASLVGLLTAKSDKTVCIVAANKIMSEKDSNAFENFSVAVELIRRKINGAFVPYRNDNGVMYVHSATDLRQADLSEDFYSFNGAFATFDGEMNICRELVSQTVPDIFTSENLPKICDNVLMIHPYPMLDYSLVGVSGKRTILHTLYHSGTLDSGSMRGFLAENNVPIFLGSLKSGRAIYTTTDEAIKNGAVPLYDIAPECAYVKLLLATAQDKMSIEKFMGIEETEGQGR